MNPPSHSPLPEMKEYRRYWCWWIWGFATLYGVMHLIDVADEQLTLPNGLRLAMPAAFVWWGLVRRRDSLRLSDSQFWVSQPRGASSPLIDLDDLTSVRWENPGAICFETRAGTPHVVSLSGLRRSQRNEIRAHLRARVPAYRVVSSEPEVSRAGPVERVEG